MQDKKYKSLITSEHCKKRKFMKWLETGLCYLNNTLTVSENIEKEFDIDRAVGVQLDILGDIAGISRILSFQPLSYSAVLDDETYRLMIKARIIANQWDGTIHGIQELWSSVFEEYPLSIIDNQDMSMKVSVSGNPNDFVQELTSHGYVVPKPSGVRINYEFIHDYPVSREFMYIGGGFGTSAELCLIDLNPIKFSKILYTAGMFSTSAEVILPDLNPTSFSDEVKVVGLYGSVLSTDLPEIGLEVNF